MHHRDGGPDPTELLLSAQPALHRPTGACHTPGKYPSQPAMGGLDNESGMKLGVFKASQFRS